MTPSILVVDDDPAVVAFLVEELQARYAVTGTTSPHAALEYIAHHDVDLVISDVEMPELRGTELLARIRQRRPDQRALLVSSFAGEANVLAKPFKRAALERAIDQALGYIDMPPSTSIVRPLK